MCHDPSACAKLGGGGIELTSMTHVASPLPWPELSRPVGVAADASPFLVALDHIGGCFPFQRSKPRVVAIMVVRGCRFFTLIKIAAVVRHVVLPVKAEDLRDPGHDRVIEGEVVNTVDEDVKQPPKPGSGAN